MTKPKSLVSRKKAKTVFVHVEMMDAPQMYWTLLMLSIFIVDKNG